MTKAQAIAQATEEKSPLTLAVVREGPHADEFAELDADGQSYGYCPVDAVPMLYRFGSIVQLIHP